MSAKNSEKAPKTKKSEVAFAIYAKHLPLKDKMKKREFRAMVIAEMSKALDCNVAGTLGGYYSWSEQVVTGRPVKVYSRGDGARARKGSKQNDAVNEELNKLSNAFSGAGAKRAAKKAEDSNDDAPFNPTGFGAARF